MNQQPRSSPPEAIAFFARALAAEGFDTSAPCGSQGHFVQADLYAKRSLRVGVFPAEDHFFIHDLTTLNTGTTFKDLHDRAREQINAQQKTPKALRWKVPCIVSIGLSDRGFDPGTLSSVMTYPRRTWVGGEINCLYLIDLHAGSLTSQGQSTVYVGMLPYRFAKIDPINRSLLLVRNLTASLLQIT